MFIFNGFKLNILMILFAISISDSLVRAEICTTCYNCYDIRLRKLEDQFERMSTKDCLDLLHSGRTVSGVYQIYTGLHSEPKRVFCDMDTDGGGWTVIQRRQDGSEEFERTWDEYKQGFGDLTGEHWLGNQYIHEITSNGREYNLRIDLTDWTDTTEHALYSSFAVDYERSKYRLDFDSYLSNESTVGDSLSHHKGQSFTTKDRDNDEYDNYNCGINYGGFWHKACQQAGLNNHWNPTSGGSGDDVYDKIRWDSWHGNTYSLQATTMMIRPIT